MASDFSDLLSGVAPTTIAALDHGRTSIDVRAGTDMVRVGEEVRWLWHVRAGRVKAWRPLANGQALTLAYLGEGAVPGLLSCCRKLTSPSTVTTVTTVAADRWSASTIHRLLGDDAIFARNAFDIVSTLAMLLIDKLDDNVGSVEQRIGRALLRLAGEEGDWRGEDKVTLALSRQDLADMTGATLFTVSRTMSDWQRRGLVESSRGRVELSDPEGIAAIAELAG